MCVSEKGRIGAYGVGREVLVCVLYVDYWMRVPRGQGRAAWESGGETRRLRVDYDCVWRR